MHSTYDISTTSYIQHDGWTLFELDCIVAVSDESEDNLQYKVRAITVPSWKKEYVPAEADVAWKTVLSDIEITHANNPKLFQILEEGLDSTHIKDCLQECRNAH